MQSKFYVLVNPTEVNQAPERGFKQIISSEEVVEFVKEYFVDCELEAEVSELLESECKNLMEYAKISSSIFGDSLIVVEAEKSKNIYAYQINGVKYSRDNRLSGITCRGWEDYYFELLEEVKTDLTIFVKSSENEYYMSDIRFVDGLVKTERYKYPFEKSVISSENFYESEELEGTEMYCDEFKVLSEALAADFSYFGKLNRIEEFFDSIEKYRGKGLESVVESYDNIIVITHINKEGGEND